MIIVPPLMTLSIHEKLKEIFINFDAELKPEASANLAILLKNIRGIKDVKIGESFFINKDHKYLEGDEAFEELKKEIKEDIVNSFMKDKMEENILRNFCFDSIN